MLYDELIYRLQNLIKDSVTGKSVKISQQTIGNILGMAQTGISFRIKNDKPFSIDELIKIADFFNVSVDFLIDGIDILKEGVNRVCIVVVCRYTGSSWADRVFSI